MIQISSLFKGMIQIETLAQMPLQFVHRLRDIRLKQLEQQQHDAEIKSKQTGSPAIPAYAAEQLMDELM